MLDRKCLVNDPWRHAINQRIRAQSPEGVQLIVAELRSIAQQLVQQTNIAPGPTRIRSLTRMQARAATGFLCGVFDCFADWETVLGCLLRWQHSERSYLDDGHASIVVMDTKATLLPSGEVIHEEHNPKRIFENEMDPAWVDEFYVNQAERWATLIGNAATMIEAEAVALNIEKELVGVENEEPPSKFSEWDKMAFEWLQETGRPASVKELFGKLPPFQELSERELCRMADKYCNAIGIDKATRKKGARSKIDNQLVLDIIKRHHKSAGESLPN